jgi:hypothetical protein
MIPPLLLLRHTGTAKQVNVASMQEAFQAVVGVVIWMNPKAKS